MAWGRAGSAKGARRRRAGARARGGGARGGRPGPKTPKPHEWECLRVVFKIRQVAVDIIKQGG